MDRRLADAQRKIGELSMDLDLLRALTEEMDRRLGRRGAERLWTAGGPAGACLSRRRGLQVGGVARRGSMRRPGWIAGRPPNCYARSAPNASAPSTSSRGRAGAALRRRPVLPRHPLPGRDRLDGHRPQPGHHYEPQTNGCVESSSARSKSSWPAGNPGRIKMSDTWRVACRRRVVLGAGEPVQSLTWESCPEPRTGAR